MGTLAYKQKIAFSLAERATLGCYLLYGLLNDFYREDRDKKGIH